MLQTSIELARCRKRVADLEAELRVAELTIKLSRAKEEAALAEVRKLARENVELKIRG